MSKENRIAHIKSKNTIYESYSMLHPDGTLMCHCNEKKAKWYVNRDLAIWTDEKTFKLKFEPNGHGKSDNPYYIQSLENRCVVCGSYENLNKHHVVPYVFRKRFPVHYKQSNHHDILATCVECHENYESFATDYKQQLAHNCGSSMNMANNDDQKFNIRVLKAQKLMKKIENKELIDKNGNLILMPQDKLESIQELALQPLKFIDHAIATMWADLIIEKVLEENSLYEFVCAWREHFIAHANPQYLPQYWSTKTELEWSDS